MIRWDGLLLAAGLLLAFPAGSQARARKPKRLHSSKRLYVNTAKRHYKVEKSREAGERDLFRLCRISDREENFVFVRYQDGRQEWYECGVNERAESAAIDMGVLDTFRKKRSQIEEITFYHHHPIERLGNLDNSQTPSEKDVQGFVAVIDVLNNVVPSLLETVDFRVVTSSGVHIFELNPRILENRRSRVMVLMTAARIDEHRARSRAYWHDNHESFAGMNAEFSRKFTSPLMRMKFAPAPANRQLSQARSSKARRLGLSVRDEDQNIYFVYYNSGLDQMILVNRVVPVLYDEKGNRIGYVGSTGEFIFDDPPGGWPKKYKRKIKLDIYEEVKEKMLAIRAIGKP